MKITIFCFLAVTTLVSAVQAQILEFTLDNGMKVIVKEDQRAPVVVSQVWYKVGSSYETDGITGVSHVLEHMMFKGTEKVGAGEFSRIVSGLGGSENAFTGKDYTAYFETLSKQHLGKALELEADRMRNLILDPAEFSKEVAVVREERRLRTEDKPSGMVSEQFNAVAWRSSPYRNPIIGWMNDLQNMSTDDLRAWYRRWYAPNNATLVVVGDVVPSEVVALARQHFGNIESVEIPLIKPLREPEQHGVTRVEIAVPAKQPYLMMGYKAPVVGSATEDWEPYALYVLSAILSGGESARLSRELVRKQRIAAAADAEYDAYARLSGMLVLDAVPTDGHSTAEVEKALRTEIERMKQELVTAEELQRVVTQEVASKVFQQDSLFYQAMLIGILETVGLDWRLLDTELDRIRAVTPEQIREVAQKYLVEDNLTIAVLKPLPMEPAASKVNNLPGGHHG